MATIDGEPVSQNSSVEAFADHDANVSCYYIDVEVNGDEASLECLYAATVPDSYPDVDTLDPISVIRNPEAETVCYHWSQRSELSCLKLRNGTATPPAPTPTP